MRIGIFGGSFNPPHVCHLLATVWAYETRPLDEIWWVPTSEHAFEKELVAFEHRWRMCEIAVDDYSYVRLDDIERDLPNPSYTIDTIRELDDRRPEDDFSLVIGSDILEETDEWKEWDELVRRVELVVVGRGDYGGNESRNGVDFALPDVSSTRAREALRVRDRDWLEQWIPSGVLTYIEDKDLYRK